MLKDSCRSSHYQDIFNEISIDFSKKFFIDDSITYTEEIDHLHILNEQAIQLIINLITNSLNKRNKLILKLILEGKTQKEIAHEVGYTCNAAVISAVRGHLAWNKKTRAGGIKRKSIQAILNSEELKPMVKELNEHKFGILPYLIRGFFTSDKSFMLWLIKKNTKRRNK